mmetsp:Transcript_13527/g.33172  ORF Transcript_13527/g.33172 Transcript_13527/m.33172 type:complete len:204 (+) Transcript_13527:729-1340(+)
MHTTAVHCTDFEGVRPCLEVAGAVSPSLLCACVTVCWFVQRVARHSGWRWMLAMHAPGGGGALTWPTSHPASQTVPHTVTCQGCAVSRRHCGRLPWAGARSRGQAWHVSASLRPVTVRHLFGFGTTQLLRVYSICPVNSTKQARGGRRLRRGAAGPAAHGGCACMYGCSGATCSRLLHVAGRWWWRWGVGCAVRLAGACVGLP